MHGKATRAQSVVRCTQQQTSPVRVDGGLRAVWSGSVLEGGAVLRQLYAGGKISACCLVAFAVAFIQGSPEMCAGPLFLGVSDTSNPLDFRPNRTTS